MDTKLNAWSMEHIYETSNDSHVNLEVVALLTGLLRWANQNVEDRWDDDLQDTTPTIHYDELRGEISRLLQVYRSMTFPDDVTEIRAQSLDQQEDFEDYRDQIRGLKKQVEVAIPFYEIAMEAWGSQDFTNHDRAIYENAMAALNVLRGS
jgi:hypothetical protein